MQNRIDHNFIIKVSPQYLLIQNMIPFVGICLPPCMLSLMSKRGYFPPCLQSPPLASKLVGGGKRKEKTNTKHTKKIIKFT
jgi:hypothetical protein